MKKEDWIPLDKNNLPPLNKDVLVSRPIKAGFRGIKPFTGIAYLFKLEKGQREGYVYGETTIKNINLAEGGIFWAFPAITRLEDVSHWMPLPENP